MVPRRGGRNGHFGFFFFLFLGNCEAIKRPTLCLTINGTAVHGVIPVFSNLQYRLSEQTANAINSPQGIGPDQGRPRTGR